MEVTVWAHDSADSNVYIDPSLLGAEEGDFAELWIPKFVPVTKKGSKAETDFASTTHSETSKSKALSSRRYSHTRHTESSNTNPQPVKEIRKNVYFQIKKPPQPFNTAKISVNPTIISSLGIHRREQVRVRLLSTAQERKRMALDVVEIHFKGVYLTRYDHYKIGKSISNCCVSAGQRLKYLNDSLRLTVTTLFRGGRKKFSGYISDDTRVVFRSDSARILIFIHMSSEMWKFDETGDIMFHRLVNTFIPEMLVRWHAQGDSHLVSLILFTSVRHLPTNSSEQGNVKPAQFRLKAGELEQDTRHFYRVVVDSAHISRWTDIMRTLRVEFERFPKEVLEDPVTHELRGYFLPSSKSNILEALSLATTLLTSKFVDRDLCRTGVQAMVVTAGQACFDVDLSDLWHLSRRLLGVEIGIELICLARPPLHVTPLFRGILSDVNRADGQSSTRLVFCVPTWINMSFWSSSDIYRQQWIPRCRIYDLQMVGLIENNARTLGLRSFNFEPNEMTNHFMRQFDAGVFKSKEIIEMQKQVEIAARSVDLVELKPRNRELHEKTAASAITTIATARPTSNSQDYEISDDTSSIIETGVESVRNLLANGEVKAENTSQVVRKSAMRSLGALLNNKSLRGTFTQGNKPRLMTSSQSLVTRRSISDQKPPHSSALSTSITSPAKPLDQGEVLAPLDSASSMVLQEPIYIKKRPFNERRESKTHNNMKASSFLSGGSPKSLGFPRSGSMSPKWDKKIGSPYSPNLGRARGNSIMCDISQPELQDESIWRVLPNSATIDNPSRLAAHGRWANVYPPKIKINGVSWHSLKSPASLPLTSESFPSLSSFREQYKFQFYDVAVDQDEITLSQLLDAMIGWRLQMGFQIAVGPNVRAIEASLPRGNPNRVAIMVPSASSKCHGIRIYMTRIGIIHRLAVDEDMLINVRLYTWLESGTRGLKSPVNKDRIEEVKVKTKYRNDYIPISKKFLDQDIECLNWSMLDQQLSGADDPLLYPSSANTQNLVTIRYVLIPTEVTIIPSHHTLTAEEEHVEGVSRFVRTLLKHRESSSVDSNFFVHYYTGKLRKAIRDIVMDSSSSLESNRLNKSISLEDLAVEMQGAMGLQFRDRRWHWKQFAQVFTGDDFVIWAMKTFEDISSTEEAVAYGVDLMSRGLFRHPEDRHPFLHGHYFYTLNPEYKQDLFSSADSDSKEPSFSSSANKAAEKKTKNDKQDSNLATVHVSESFVINVDPKSNGRPERAKVSVDRVHNPKNAFHIIVEWLNATPKSLDDLFSGIGRTVSQYGLRLVQVPVADVCGSIEDSPFRSEMALSINIQIKDEEEQRWFRHYLLRKQGYVLDIHDRKDVNSDKYEVLFLWGRLKSSSPQYIHSSGYVLVQMDPQGNFYVTPNTLHISRAVMVGNAAHTADGECEKLMKHLMNLCADEKALEDLLVEARQYREKSKGLSVEIIKSNAGIKENPPVK